MKNLTPIHLPNLDYVPVSPDNGFYKVYLRGGQMYKLSSAGVETPLFDFTETDPIFSSSPAFNISTYDILTWNTAVNWGDHAAQGYLKSADAATLYAPVAHTHAFSELTGVPTTLSGYGITDPIVVTTGSYSDPAWITSLSWSKITGAPSFVTSLAALTDVELTSDSTNQYLQYNGTKWVNASVPVPTLNSVTTSGNTTTNSITVGGLTVDTNLIYTDTVNNRVGINNSSPAYAVDAIGSNFRFGRSGSVDFDVANTASSRILRFTASATDVVIQNLGNYDIGFNNNFSRVMTLKSSGNVLIGTTTDAGYKLDVNGTVRVQGSVTNTSGGFIANLSSPTNDAFFTIFGGNIGFYTSNQYTKAQRLNLTNTTGVPSALNNVLSVSGSITASSALAAGVFFNNTLVAAANNDVLVGLDINPTFTNGAFTGVSNASLRVQAGNVWLNSTSGNTLIGTTTDAGYKLDVNGTARVQGRLIMTGDYIQYGSNANVGIGSTSTGAIFSNNSKSLLYASANIFTSAVFAHYFFTGTFNATSGNQGVIATTSAAFSPTSGTATFTGINLAFTINQTGGANGITRGLYINPTLTSAFDYRAIETTAGKIIHQGLTNATHGNQVYYNTTTGELTYGALPTVATPTLAQVTTAGNTTTNAVTVDKLTVSTGTSKGIEFGGTKVVEAANLSSYTQLLTQPISGNKTVVFMVAPSGTEATSVLELYHSSSLSSNQRVAFKNVNGLLQLGGDVASFPIEFIGSNNAWMKIFATGNVAINSTTDAGYKLDVNGTTILRDYLQISNGGTFSSAGNALVLYLTANPSGQSNGGESFKIRRDATVAFRNYYADNTTAGVHINYYFASGTAPNLFVGRNYSNLATTALAAVNNPTGTHDFTGSIASGITTGGIVSNNNVGTGLSIVQRYETDNYTASTNSITYGVYSLSTTTSAVLTAGAYKRWVGGYFSAQPSFATSNANVVSIGIWANAQGSQTNYSGLFTGGYVGIGTTTPVSWLQVTGSITAASALAQGVYFNNTLVAAANNDVLVGLDISTTFTNGAFTGVANYGLRIGGSTGLIYDQTNNRLSTGGLPTNPISINTSTANPNGTIALFKTSLDDYTAFQVQNSIAAWQFSVRPTADTSNPGGFNFYYSGNNGASWNNIMTLRTNGNVGIGTTTDAGYKLDVSGTMRSTNAAYFATSSGNVGIGTLSPTDTNSYGKALDIQSNAGAAAYFRDSDDTSKYFLSGFAGQTTNHGIIGTWGTDTLLRVFTSGNERMRIDSFGNVGIGTTAPGYKLEVAGTFRSSGAAYASGGLGVNLTGGLTSDFDVNGFAKVRLDLQVDRRIYVNDFLYIGTSTFSGYKLDVNGTTRISGNTTVVGQVTATNGSDTTNLTSAGINMNRFYCYIVPLSNNSQTLFFGDVTKGVQDWAAISFKATNVELAANVGVNTASPTVPLDVNGAARIQGNMNAQTYSVNGTAGWTGTITIPTNPPGQQNIAVTAGIITNVF